MGRGLAQAWGQAYSRLLRAGVLVLAGQKSLEMMRRGHRGVPKISGSRHPLPSRNMEPKGNPTMAFIDTEVREHV